MTNIYAVDVADATAAAARTDYKVDIPIWVISTNRWYRFVNDKAGVSDDGDDVIYVTSGGSLQATTPRPWRGAGSGYKEFKPNPYDQTDDTVLHSTILWTSSAGIWKSSIGKQTRPVGIVGGISDPAAPVDSEAGIPWTNDTTYPSGIADVATIVGGYDHVNNQLAGTVVGGGHLYLQYNLSGHGTMVGGSNNRNAGGYSAMVGGTQNTVGAGNYGGTYAGAYNVVNGSYSIALGGSLNRITSEGIYSAAIGGNNNRVEEDRSVALGGEDNTAKHSHAVVMGKGGTTEASGYHTIASKTLVNQGDAQSFTGSMALRTTSGSSSNMSGVNNVLHTVGNDYDASLFVEIMLIARDEATGDTSSFKIEAVGKWDGTTYHLYKGGAGGTSEPSFDVVLDQIGLTPPTLAFNTGALRPRISGKASTNIKWSAFIKGTIVRV